MLPSDRRMRRRRDPSDPGKGTGARPPTRLTRPQRPEQSSDVLTFPTRRSARSVVAMPSFLVETYLARGSAGERTTRDRRARSAAEELTREGTRVRFDRSIHVPEDEICFFIFDAPSGREAALAAQRARLEPLRVVEAIPSRKEWQ